jgi:hypothetical protein
MDHSGIPGTSSFCDTESLDTAEFGETRRNLKHFKLPPTKTSYDQLSRQILFSGGANSLMTRIRYGMSSCRLIRKMGPYLRYTKTGVPKTIGPKFKLQEAIRMRSWATWAIMNRGFVPHSYLESYFKKVSVNTDSSVFYWLEREWKNEPTFLGKNAWQIHFAESLLLFSLLTAHHSLLINGMEHPLASKNSQESASLWQPQSRLGILESALLILIAVFLLVAPPFGKIGMFCNLFIDFHRQNVIHRESDPNDKRVEESGFYKKVWQFAGDTSSSDSKSGIYTIFFKLFEKGPTIFQKNKPMLTERTRSVPYVKVYDSACRKECPIHKSVSQQRHSILLLIRQTSALSITKVRRYLLHILFLVEFTFLLFAWLQIWELLLQRKTYRRTRTRIQHGERGQRGETESKRVVTELLLTFHNISSPSRSHASFRS